MKTFYDFIKDDVKAKKLLVNSMPTKTKTNKRKFNEKIEELELVYNDYLNNITKYIDAKASKLEIKDTLDSSVYLNKISKMEKKLNYLNFNNTYLEKLEIDKLLYKLRNQEYFNFTYVNQTIMKLIDKFNLVGVTLTKKEFNYTPYVKKYMNVFFEITDNQIKNYDLLTSTFEAIYWKNPDLITHIELNFRKLLRDYSKEFNDYIKRQESQIKNTTNHDYLSLEQELKKVYLDLKIENRENIVDIINLSKNDSINVDELFEDSKARISALNNLQGTLLDSNDDNKMDKFYYNLSNLRANLEEFSNYQKFNELINYFINNYSKLKEDDYTKNLKNLESQISKEESALYKINRKADSRNIITQKEAEFKSIKKANEIKKMYDDYIALYFKEKINGAMRSSFNVNDLLKFYNSFDYYLYGDIKKVYKLDTYEEIKAHCDNFSFFASNLANVIRTPLTNYNLNEISSIISGKYNLLNINITNDQIDEGSIESFLDDLNITLRVKVILESKIDVETLWFIKEAHKIKEKNKNK